MKRHIFAIGAVVVLTGARDPGCGDSDHERGGENAPCTRDKDCKDGLFCTRGVCVDPDAGPPDAAPDADTDAPHD